MVAVKFGHQGAAAVDDGHVGHAVGGGGEGTQVGNRAQTKEFGDDRIAGDMLEWTGTRQREGTGRLEKLRDWEPVEDAQDGIKGAPTSAGGSIKG